VLFSKMRRRQQRNGRGPVKMSYLHEAMCLIVIWHAKMRQRGLVVQSDMWRWCCVKVLVYERLRLKRVTIDRYRGISPSVKSFLASFLASNYIGIILISPSPWSYVKSILVQPKISFSSTAKEIINQPCNHACCTHSSPLHVPTL
jgi:hypothetical protein